MAEHPALDRVRVLRRAGGRVRTILSADRVAQNYEFVPVVGEGTVSRSVSYQSTAGCEEEPAGCPERTARAEPFLTGTSERRGRVNGGLDVVHLPPGPDRDHDCGNARPIAAGLRLPYGFAAGRALPLPTLSAFAIPRGPLLNPNRMRLKDSVTVKEPLRRDRRPGRSGTVSGTYTDHLAITLRRLKL